MTNVSNNDQKVFFIVSSCSKVPPKRDTNTANTTDMNVSIWVRFTSNKGSCNEQFHRLRLKNVTPIRMEYTAQDITNDVDLLIAFVNMMARNKDDQMVVKMDNFRINCISILLSLRVDG